MVVSRLFFDYLSMNFIKNGDRIGCAYSKIFVRIPSKYFRRNALCSFLVMVAFIKLKLYGVLFLRATSDFKGLSQNNIGMLLDAGF